MAMQEVETLPTIVFFKIGKQETDPVVEIPLSTLSVEHTGFYTTDWNDYPEVTPPEGILMRVEANGNRKFCAYFCHQEHGGVWCFENGTICPEELSIAIQRFRPWED